MKKIDDVKLVPKSPPAPHTAISNTHFTAFASTIYDVTGLNRLNEQLNLIERSLFKDKKGTISSKARDYLSGRIISIFEEIEKAGLEPIEDQKQLQFIKDLVRYVRSLPVVKVTIAFEPTHSFIMKLNNQISASVGKKVILDTIIDEDVIGGAIFEHNGRISEQTLRTKLHDSLEVLVERAYSQKS